MNCRTRVRGARGCALAASRPPARELVRICAEAAWGSELRANAGGRVSGCRSRTCSARRSVNGKVIEIWLLYADMTLSARGACTGACELPSAISCGQFGCTGACEPPSAFSCGQLSCTGACERPSAFSCGQLSCTGACERPSAISCGQFGCTGACAGANLATRISRPRAASGGHAATRIALLPRDRRPHRPRLPGRFLRQCHRDVGGRRHQ